MKSLITACLICFVFIAVSCSSDSSTKTDSANMPDNSVADSDNFQPDQSLPDGQTDSANSKDDTAVSDGEDANLPDPDNALDTDEDNQSQADEDQGGQPDADGAVEANPFAAGPHKVVQVDIAENAKGNALAVRIFHPAEAGTYPFVNFIHGFQLKNSYYDQILTQLASFGFVVVSPQLKQSLTGGDTSIVEAEKVAAFIDSWVIPNLAQNTGSAVPDFTKIGLAGHSRGTKISWRMFLANPPKFMAIMGVDPVDTNKSTSDPYAITGPLSYTQPSAVIGTEKGPTGLQACAPADANSAGRFYPNLPSPAWHLIAGGVGHMDMIDADDLTACGITCSLCSGGTDPVKATFRTLSGGLLAAFFRASLYGETNYYNYFVNTSGLPHPIVKAEHK